jgi:hypothetical protein
MRDVQKAPMPVIKPDKVTAGGERMVALPYTYELNDAPLLMRSHMEGGTFAQRWLAQFDRLRREGDPGRMTCLVLHPFTIGQPHRIRHRSDGHHG